ncbi:tripartite tricarboxylate transporter substrate-binding protein [Mycobacterium sp. NPDC003449]
MIRNTLRCKLLALAVAGLTLSTGCSSLTQTSSDTAEFPGTQPVTFLMPYTAGGSSDLLVRDLQPYLEKTLGTKIIVDNRVGAGGQVALTELANAEPDGHTIGLTNLPSTLAYIDPDKRAPYKRDSFEPIGTINRFQGIVAVAGNGKWPDLAALIADAKARPGSVTVGVDGLNGDDHIAALRFMQATGTSLKIVPFDSGSEKLIALVGGEIDMSLGTVPTFRSQLSTGEVKALAALEAHPIPGLDGVPTATSLGYDLQWDSYNVASAPAGLNPDVSKKLQDALAKASSDALADPAFVEKMKAGGFVFGFKDAAWTEKTWAELESQWNELVPLARKQGHGN